MNNQNNKSKKNSKSTKVHTVPAAFSKPVVTRKPNINGNPYAENGSIRVCHSEFLSDITGQINFTNTSFSVNPGLPFTFPWLSSLANNFESYKFHSLKFRYDPICGTGTQGSVLLAVDFDAADAPATTKQQIMSYHNACRGAAWDCTEYVSSRSDLLKFGTQRFVRSTDVAGTDIKTYDVGNFQIATVNSQTDNFPFGELYVDYDVELYTPQTQSGQITQLLAQQSMIELASSSTITAIPVNTTYGSVPIYSFPTSGVSQLVFTQAGQYLLVVSTISTELVCSLDNIMGESATVTSVGSASTSLRSYIVRVGQPSARVLIEPAVGADTTSPTIRATVYPQPLN